MILLRKYFWIDFFNVLLSKKQSKEARIALKDQPTSSPSFTPYPKDSNENFNETWETMFLNWKSK